MKPILSVVLPTYNRAFCIERMILSILNQNYTKGSFELIIVDDGSTDGTLNILKEKYKDDPRIVLFHQENQGVSSARNRGILEARGEFITFVDDDDYLLDGFFEDIFDSIEESLDVLVYSGKVERRKKIIHIPLFFGNQSYAEAIKGGREFVEDFCYYSGNSWACAKVFRRDFLICHQIFFNRAISYGEDMIFNIKSYWFASKVLTKKQGYYVVIPTKHSLSRIKKQNDRKINELLKGYDELQTLGIPQSALALNYIRHIRQWVTFDTKQKEKLLLLYERIDPDDCYGFEKIEVRYVRKSFLFVMIAKPTLWVYAKVLKIPLIHHIARWIKRRVLSS